MYHRDYLIRMIQQFIVFMAKLAGLRKKDDPDVILMELEGAYLQFTGMSMDALHALSAEGIVSLYSSSGEKDANRIMVTAILFKEEADVLMRIQNIDAAMHLYNKSLSLMSEISEEDLHEELKKSFGIKDEIEKHISI